MFGTILTQVFIVCLVSLGIGTLMEWYKKKVRGDKAGVWEIRGIALVASLAVGALLVFTGIAYPVFASLFPNMATALANVLNLVLYGAVIFVLQLQSDMKLVKSILRLVSSKVSFEDIVKILESFKKATGVKPATIANLMVLLGVTDDVCVEALVKAGVPEEEAVKIMIELNKALNPNATNEEITSRVQVAYNK